MSQTLDRALQILGFVGEKPRRIGEIAEFLDVHHSTALRFLHTLRKHGFVHELPDHRYRLVLSVVALSDQHRQAQIGVGLERNRKSAVVVELLSGTCHPVSLLAPRLITLRAEKIKRNLRGQRKKPAAAEAGRARKEGFDATD